MDVQNIYTELDTEYLSAKMEVERRTFMSTESDLRTFISAKEKELSFHEQHEGDAQHAVDAAQCRHAIEQSQVKLAKLIGRERRFNLINEDGAFYSTDDKGYFWQNKQPGCLSLPLVQITAIALRHFGAEFIQKGYKIKEHY